MDKVGHFRDFFLQLLLLYKSHVAIETRNAYKLLWLEHDTQKRKAKATE